MEEEYEYEDDYYNGDYGYYNDYVESPRRSRNNYQYQTPNNNENKSNNNLAILLFFLGVFVITSAIFIPLFFIKTNDLSATIKRLEEKHRELERDNQNLKEIINEKDDMLDESEFKLKNAEKEIDENRQKVARKEQELNGYKKKLAEQEDLKKQIEDELKILKAEFEEYKNSLENTTLELIKRNNENKKLREQLEESVTTQSQIPVYPQGKSKRVIRSPFNSLVKNDNNNNAGNDDNEKNTSNYTFNDISIQTFNVRNAKLNPLTSASRVNLVRVYFELVAVEKGTNSISIALQISDENGNYLPYERSSAPKKVKGEIGDVQICIEKEFQHTGTMKIYFHYEVPEKYKLNKGQYTTRIYLKDKKSNFYSEQNSQNFNLD